MKSRPKIIAVDFDGTLCDSSFPDCGPPIKDVVDALLAEQAAGCITILWTNRRGDALDKAVTWCMVQGIRLDYVNENTKEMIEFFGGNPRKVFANEYWDDRAKEMPLVTAEALGGKIYIPEFFGSNICAKCRHEWIDYPSVATFCPGCKATLFRK